MATLRRTLRTWAIEPSEAQKHGMVIDWHSKGRLRYRIWRRLPCWLVGHNDIWNNSKDKPTEQWCMRCDKKWLR
jgi:hypothetical protein